MRTEIDSIPDAQRVPVSVETGDRSSRVTERPHPYCPARRRQAPSTPCVPLTRCPLLAFQPVPATFPVAVVNGRVEVPYDNVPHLWQALRNE